MKPKAKKRLTMALALVLVLLLIIPLIISALTPSAHALTSQEELDSLKDEAAYLEQRKEEITAEIAYVEQQTADTIEKKTLLDQKIIITQEEITNANLQLQQYTVIIAEMQKDIDVAIEEERAQFQLFKDRMRAIEETGNISYWSIVFSAGSISDLLDSIDIVNELLAYDEKIISDLYEMRAELDESQRLLEESKAEQKAVKDNLVLLEAEMEGQRAEADALIIRLIEQKAGLEDFYAELEKQEAQVAQDIDAMIARIEEEQRRAAAQGGSTNYISGTGIFTWPTPSTTYITSEFGTRLHPTLGVYKFHTGVDIGAGYGAAIVAADSGTVITAGYNSGGYGNYVVISHGNGISTLYGHMSSYIVYEGQNVSRGETIGYVGSTGRSTGPHLHFEVRQNGQYLDPLSFF